MTSNTDQLKDITKTDVIVIGGIGTLIGMVIGYVVLVFAKMVVCN